jgi:hypothetical protein
MQLEVSQKLLHQMILMQEDTRATGLTAFGSDGFTVGSDSNANGSSNTYASWNWKAGGTASSNTDGSISSSSVSKYYKWI